MSGVKNGDKHGDVYKGSTREPCGNGIKLSILAVVLVIKSYTCGNCTELYLHIHTHRNKSVNGKTGETSASWIWYSITVIQDVTTGGHSMKDIVPDRPIYIYIFFAMSGEFIINSKWTVKRQKKLGTLMDKQKDI